MMSTEYEQQRLQASFTFRILDAVKRMRIHPTPRTAGLPWGLSLATGIVITILSLGPHLSIPRPMTNPTGSRFAGEMNAMEAGEIPVDVLLLDSKQGDGDSAESELSESHAAASVTATHSEGDTQTQENVADKGSIIIDPETGLKFTRIFSDEKLDVIEDASWMTVSPDGRFLFTQWGNWVVPLEEGDPFKLIDRSFVAEFPSWSPDGSKISLLSEGALWFIPVSLETGRANGPAKKLADRLRRLSTWSPDGKMIAYAANGDIWKIPVAGGTREQITDSPVKEFDPAWSPDGSRIAFVRVRDEKTKVRDIWFISPRGGNASKIIEDGTYPRWSSDGKCILFLRRDPVQGEKLWIFQLSSKRECKIEPPGDWRAYFYSTKDGKLLFLDTGTSYRSALKVVSVYGGPSMDLCSNVDGKVWPYHQSWSPDGNWIITCIEEGERPNAIWMVSTSGKKSIPVHLEHVEEYYYPTPTWSPDGSKLAYLSENSLSRNRSLWVVPFSSDTGQPTGSAIKIADILTRDLNYGAVSWSPDAKKIAFTTRESGNNDIWVSSVIDGKTVQLTDGAENVMNPQWSPDGEKIAYVVEEKGSWLIPAAGGEPKQIIEEGEAYSWSPDASKIVFFAKPHISTIDVANGEVKHIVDTEKLGAGGIFSICWSPDGKNLAFLSAWSSSSADGYAKYDLWVVPAAGGSPTKLATDDPGAKYSLYWSPDGKRISYNSDGYVKLHTASIWEADVSELLSSQEREQ